MKLKITIKKSTVTLICFVIFIVLVGLFIRCIFPFYCSGTFDVVPVISMIAAIIAVLIAGLTYGVAKKIPYRVLVNQIYADLLTEYRSAEMGFAIRAIFNFQKKCKETHKDKYSVCLLKQAYKQCRECCPKNFCKEYKEDCAKGENAANHSVDCYKKTLTYQRRLIDQYFWQVGDLTFGKNYPCFARLKPEFLRNWFTKRERELLEIILALDKAEDEKQTTSGDTTVSDRMWEIRNKLQKESQYWH
jgi:hypothetical protein